MNKFQFLNVYTQEILREGQFNDQEFIDSLILNCKREGSYIVDSDYRMLDIDFVFSNVLEDGNEKIHRLYFKIKQTK